MRALWSDRQNCSHNVSQKVKRIKRVSDKRVLADVAWTPRARTRAPNREEHSMDQYRSRLKLSETLSAIGPYEFRGKFIWTNHWSIPFPGEIRMEEWSWKFF